MEKENPIWKMKLLAMHAHSWPCLSEREGDLRLRLEDDT
jgi:hypothetical protein